MRRIAACAIIAVERTRVSQVTPESPGTPHAMVYSLWRALPGERLFCHRRLAPLLARLDTSTAMSGPHAFAVRFKRPRQERHPRPSHPRPTLMTLRNAPLAGTGWRINTTDLGQAASVISEIRKSMTNHGLGRRIDA